MCVADSKKVGRPYTYSSGAVGLRFQAP